MNETMTSRSIGHNEKQDGIRSAMIMNAINKMLEMISLINT